jgi:transcriptional regulator with XRE-family HTH domain
MFFMRTKSHKKKEPAWQVRNVVTQNQLAIFLDVSPSLMAMFEKGLRSLPYSATMKLAGLEADFNKNKSIKKRGSFAHPLQSTLDKSDDKRTATYLKHLKRQHMTATLLQYQLDQFIQSYEYDKIWLDIIDHRLDALRLATLPKTEEFTRDTEWLELQQGSITERIKKNHNVIAGLQLKVDLLRAEVGVYEGRLKNQEESEI